MAMAPVVEVRGAIPYGIAMGLDSRLVIALSLLGSMIPVPFIVLFIRRIFAWIRVRSAILERFIGALERRTLAKGSRVNKYKALGLVVFSALPLPGTGAWSGALLAALLNIRLIKALPLIFIGVLIDVLVVTGIVYGVRFLF